MNEIKTILVSTDHVMDRTPGIQAAAVIASTSGANLVAHHVVRGIDQSYSFLTDNLSATLEKEAQESVEKACAATGVSPSPATTCEVAVGSAVAEVMSAIETHKPDLVVLDIEAYGDHGTGSVSTVAKNLVHSLPHDCLLVRDGFEGPYKNICVAVDFSSGSTAAMERAISVAKQNGNSSVTALHAFKLPPRHWYAGVTEDQAREHALAHAKKHYDEWIPKIDTQGIDVEPVFTEGAPAFEIGRVAKLRGADLIVLGSVGHTSSSVLLLGSVAEDLLHRAHCSVWVEREEEQSMSFARAIAKLMGLS